MKKDHKPYLYDILESIDKNKLPGFREQIKKLIDEK